MELKSHSNLIEANTYRKHNEYTQFKHETQTPINRDATCFYRSNLEPDRSLEPLNNDLEKAYRCLWPSKPFYEPKFRLIVLNRNYAYNEPEYLRLRAKFDSELGDPCPTCPVVRMRPSDVKGTYLILVEDQTFAQTPRLTSVFIHALLHLLYPERTEQALDDCVRHGLLESDDSVCWNEIRSRLLQKG